MTAANAAENVVVKQPPIDTLSSSIASNPQQGMADQRVLTAGTASGTKGPTPPLAPCSPLTISSALEQQQTAANNPAAVADGVAPVGGIPVAVVGGPFMEAPPALGVPTAAAAPVSSTDERRWKRTPPTEVDSRKLFVGGLPTNVNDEQFLCFFEQFGEVIDSVVMVDRNTKRSRGFGFVTFANQQVTDSLLNNIPGKTGVLNIFGKSCEIKASEPKVDDGRHDSSSPTTRRYPYNGSNNPGGKKMVMQQFNQHQRVGMPNQYNRDNGYTGDERDFDDVNYHFEPNHQGYYNHGGYHHNMMMYHHPYGYAQYQNYPPNYSTYGGPGPNYEGGEGGGGGAQYHNYYPAGYYPNQQFHGQYGANPMYHGEGGGNGEGMPPYTQAQQQQHANYGVHYSQDGQMYHGQFNDGGSVGSTSYEAQVYPATTSGVDGDYGQTAAGDTQS